MSASREKRLRRELREAEANSDIVKKKVKKKKPMTIVRARKIRSAILSAIAIVLVVVFALLIFVNSGFMQTHATALTVGSHKVTPAEFNYFYQDSYFNIRNSYSQMWSYLVDTTQPLEDQECMFSEDGGSWSDYLTDAAGQSAVQVFTLYDAAMEAGYTLSEDEQATIDAMPDTIETYAEAYGYKDGDEYLEATYGKGASVATYTEYMRIQEIASDYAAEKGESFSYTDDELRTYYNENKLDFDKVTYRVFNVTTENDDTAAAKETADAMDAEVTTTEDSFIKAALSYAPEDSKESYEDDSYTLRSSANYSNVSTSYADWLFDEGRAPGEHSVFATDSGYSVVMFVSRDNNDYNTVNVRHILVNVEKSGEDSTATDADWATCREKMDEILAEWEESDMTEDTFAEMANEHSEDTGSNTNGGLYENVYKGQMVPSFNDWCFDPSRAVGDYGVVESDYGCHLIYFSGTGDLYWKSLADDAKRSDDYTAWYEERSASYTAGKGTIGQWFTTKTLAS